MKRHVVSLAYKIRISIITPFVSFVDELQVPVKGLSSHLKVSLTLSFIIH